MRVRKLDADGDMCFGRSQGDFLVNSPEAVAQCVLTRLRLYVGEWFLDTADGTAWFTKVLGRRTESVRDPVIKARILGTAGVTSISTYSSQVDRVNRSIAVQCSVKTVYDADSAAATRVLATLTNPFPDVRISR